MQITNIKFDIINEENDYSAESRAQKMREMANELRAQRDKAAELYVPATQEIGWKKVEVFLENIEKQIAPLLFVLKEIEQAEGKTGRYGIHVFTPGEKISRWDLWADENDIGIEVKSEHETYGRNFPDTWVNENGEPRGSHAAEFFYGERGIVANTDFSGVLKAIDKTVDERYNLLLQNMRHKQAYYENTFKKMANIDENISLDSIIKNAVNKAAQSAVKETVYQKDYTKE